MLKSFPKILMIFFLIIFIFQLASLIFLFALPQTSQAADIKFKPQVGIPVKKQAGDTFDFSGNTENIFPKDGSTKPIAEYIRVIYKYSIGIVGILAAVVLMVGGVMWIVAGGNATAIGEAKAWIGASLTGLVIALCSYLILATINPALVDLKTTTVSSVQALGCCEKNSTNQGMTTQSECTKNGGTWGGADSVWSATDKKCITAAENSTGCCLIGTPLSVWLGCRNDIKKAKCTSLDQMGFADSLNMYKTSFVASYKCSTKDSNNEYSCIQ